MSCIPKPTLDPVTIARYAAAEPSYAGYPSPSRLAPGFDQARLRTAIRTSNEELIPRSLSLSVQIPTHFAPRCRDSPGCVDASGVARADRYLARLYREIEVLASLFDRDRTLHQLHLGGGISSALDLTQLGELMESLTRHFSFGRDGRRELGIDFDSWHMASGRIKTFGAMGFNCLCLRLPDMGAETRLPADGAQDVAGLRKMLDEARTVGFHSVHVELVSGQPGQTGENFEKVLAKLAALAPDRVSVYDHAHWPISARTLPLAETAPLPNPTNQLTLFSRAIEALYAMGYVRLSMNQFARPDENLVLASYAGILQRNFCGYCIHGDCDLVGLGVGAISRIGDMYCQNASDPASYCAALDAGVLPVARGLTLDEDDLVRRALIDELACHGQLDMHAFAACHRLIFAEYFSSELARLMPLADDGLVTLDNRMIGVTLRGKLLLHSIATCFDVRTERDLDQPR